MPSIVLTQEQLDMINSDLKREKVIQDIHEKWQTINKTQKLFVLEYLKVLHPHKEKQLNEVIKKVKSNQLNEAWYNTVLDIVGWLDPTGIADTLNGVIYLTQGEYLFGFLSFVGAIPYAGDVVAKPVMYALKAGKPSAKALNGVMKLSKVGTKEATEQAANELAKLSASGGLIGWFTTQMGKLAPKLEQLINAMPGGVLKGFKNTLLEWIQLFKGASKGKAVRTQAADLATKIKGIPAGSAGIVRLSKKDQIAQLENLIKLSKETPGIFSGYRTGNKILSWKTFWGGMPQLMGRNRSVRALMRKTKWYLGLLDFLGIANFVGPDELQEQLGDAKFEQSIEAYNDTNQSRQYAQEDFGSEAAAQDFLNRQDGVSTQAPSQAPPQTTDQPREKPTLDPLSWLLSSTLKGAL
jgi:hypothetical protein